MAGHVRSAESLLPPFPPTLPNVLRHAAECFGEKEFLVCGERCLTFRQADEESGNLALGLLALGVGKGTRVGIMMANSPDWILSWLAAARIGALTVPISTLYQAPELRWVLEHSDIETLLMVDHYLTHDYMARLETVPALAAQVQPLSSCPNSPTCVMSSCGERRSARGPSRAPTIWSSSENGNTWIGSSWPPWRRRSRQPMI